MRAIKYCNCRQDETSSDEMLQSWLVGSVQRGHMKLRLTSIMITVVVHQGIYKCNKCKSVDHIAVLQAEIKS